MTRPILPAAFSCATAALVLGCSQADPALAPPAGEATSALDEVAWDVISRTGSPGAAVLRACGGEPAQIGVAGVRIAGDAGAITPQDLWHLGSNTKAMTATLAARLVEQGVIGWDATLAGTLEGLDLEIHPDLAGVSLVELLTHRSAVMANAGIVTSIALSGADSDRDPAADRRAYAAAVVSEPGGDRGGFLYSNAGYVLAGLMLETAAGAPYEALMAREVFEPLGMDSAGWGPPGAPGEADQPRGHRRGLLGGLGAREPGAGADNPPAMNSAGRAHMTFADLADFLTAHLERPAGYLSADSWTRLHTPPAGADYALGWGVDGAGRLAHAGSNTMWFVRMAVDPGAPCVLAAGVNDGRIDEVAGPVSDAMAALAVMALN